MSKPKKKPQDQLSQLYQELTGQIPSSVSSTSSNSSSNSIQSAMTEEATQAAPFVGVTRTDLKLTADDVTSSVNQHVDQQATAITANVQQFVDDAYHNGKDKTFNNLSQKLESQQARIDAMNVNKTESERMASADHSLLEQLKQHFAQTMLIVKTNTDTESKLIQQMQKSIKIDGNELVQAIESEAGKSVNKMISQKVVKYINTAVRSVENNRQATEQSNGHVISVVQRATLRLSMLLTMIGLLVVIPGWQFRLIVAGIGIVGGGIYGIIRKSLD